VRAAAASIVLLIALLAGQAGAAPAPAYVVTFSGTGSEHQLDQKQNIQDDGTCDSAEHVDVTAGLAWTASWPALRAGARTALGNTSRIDGSTLTGSHVKDACGLPLDRAPAGWVSEASCDTTLVPAGPASLRITNAKDGLLLMLAAPPFAVPPSAPCSLNVRNDQLTATVLVPAKKLRTLKKRGTLTFTVGTAAPGPGDSYAPSLDCSQPTKPYEGYRTADHCQDQLSWSGTVKLTRIV
jgi:hypothetical protein